MKIPLSAMLLASVLIAPTARAQSDGDPSIDGLAAKAHQLAAANARQSAAAGAGR